MGLANGSLDAVNKNETHFKSKYKEKKGILSDLIVGVAILLVS
jgi:hypothetical protein